MGERAEIYILDENSGVELWCHWCGRKEEFLHAMDGFVNFAIDCVGDQLHWLNYPTDVAAMLIAYDYEEMKALQKRYRWNKCRPDIRPRGNIWDFGYIWIIKLEGKFWRVLGFCISDMDIPEKTMEKLRELLRNGKLEEALSLEIKENKTLHDYIFAEKTYEVYQDA